LIKQIPIPRPLTISLISKKRKAVVLFFANNKLAYAHFTPQELQFISLEKQAVIGSIQIDGAYQ